jgi:acetyl esterase/lipase
MKKTLLALAAVITVIAAANRPVLLSELESLAALDRAAGHETTRAVFTTINEHALHVLPTAATLRAEDAIASLVLRDGAKVAAR